MRDGLGLSFAEPMIQWGSNPTAVRLWETFTLTITCSIILPSITEMFLKDPELSRHEYEVKIWIRGYY